jgi:hypothetical protein
MNLILKNVWIVTLEQPWTQIYQLVRQNAISPQRAHHVEKDLYYLKKNAWNALTLTQIVSHALIQTECRVQNVKLASTFNQKFVSSVKVTVRHVLQREPVRDVKPDIIWQSKREVYQVFVSLVIVFARHAVQHQLNANHVQISMNWGVSTVFHLIESV